MERNISITICIVTFNGFNRLKATFDNILELIIPKNVDLSIVVVDNASTDETPKFIHSYWLSNKSQIQAKIKSMKTNDLAKARQLAYEGLDTDFVLTCDDDNLLPEDYLIKGLSYFNNNPKIGVLGGKGILPANYVVPNWFHEYSYFFGCGNQAEFTGNVFPHRNVVYGAGMWHKHNLILKANDLGYISLIKSRKGKRLGGGEDSETCWIIKYLGYEVWYADDLVFVHNVALEKLTEKYKMKLVNSLSVQKDIYTNIHQRIYNHEIKDKVNFFWLKEIIHHLKTFCWLPWQQNVNRVLEGKRIWYSIFRLVVENFKFDKTINLLIEFREKSKI